MTETLGMTLGGVGLLVLYLPVVYVIWRNASNLLAVFRVTLAVSSPLLFLGLVIVGLMLVDKMFPTAFDYYSGDRSEFRGISEAFIGALIAVHLPLGGAYLWYQLHQILNFRIKRRFGW